MFHRQLINQVRNDTRLQTGVLFHSQNHIRLQILTLFCGCPVIYPSSYRTFSPKHLHLLKRMIIHNKQVLPLLKKWKK